GVAAAKIVQAYSQPGSAQRFQTGNSHAFLLKDSGFGNFQLQPPRFHPRLSQLPQHHTAEMRLTQLYRRHIYRHPGIEPFIAPSGQLPASKRNNLLTQPDDKAAAFGNGNEAVRVDQPEIRML